MKKGKNSIVTAFVWSLIMIIFHLNLLFLIYESISLYALFFSWLISRIPISLQSINFDTKFQVSIIILL